MANDHHRRPATRRRSSVTLARGLGRHRRTLIPRTLIPDAGAASQAETLGLFAAAIITRCHAQILRRYATQIANNQSAAAAIAAWTETWGDPTLAEATLAEATLTEPTLSEHASKEPTV